MEKRKKRMKKREKEGIGFPEFSGTYFRELISRPEFQEGLKIVLVLDLEIGNGKIKVFTTLVSTCEKSNDRLNFWHLGVEKSHHLIIIFIINIPRVL